MWLKIMMLQVPIILALCEYNKATVCYKFIGAIYLTCLNLPREERYKKGNIIVAGIIPSMAEGGEPPSINTCLQPLIKDLRTLLSFLLNANLTQSIKVRRLALVF